MSESDKGKVGNALKEHWRREMARNSATNHVLHQRLRWRRELNFPLIEQFIISKDWHPPRRPVHDLKYITFQYRFLRPKYFATSCRPFAFIIQGISFISSQNHLSLGHASDQHHDI